jgi:chromosome partitioning protein
MPKVFISHSSLNKQFVRREIVEFLEGHGIETWYSENDLRPGRNWGHDLGEALDACEWFLLVLSPHAVCSEPVRKEVERALARKPAVPIVPVLLTDCDPAPLGAAIVELQYIDFRRDYAAARSKLLAFFVRQLHEQWEASAEKVRQLSDVCERLRELQDELEEEVRCSAEQITSLARFDGKSWEKPVQPPVPRFVPRASRRCRIIAVTNLKGGVGKTTLTANLSAALCGLGQRVLMLDLDYQGTLTSICLSGQEIEDLRRQRRFVQNLFREDEPRPAAFLGWAQRVQGGTGFVMAADEDLAELEMQSLARWLVQQASQDVRFLLREVLHSDEVQGAFDFVFLDCPPRLTTACINALAASDYVLIPTLLDQPSSDAVPRQLRWLRKLQPLLFPQLAVLGIIGNRAFPRQNLVSREQQTWHQLPAKCAHAWGAPVHHFRTIVRDNGAFAEAAKQNTFAALRSELRPAFLDLVTELRKEMSRHESPEPADAPVAP